MRTLIVLALTCSASFGDEIAAAKAKATAALAMAQAQRHRAAIAAESLRSLVEGCIADYDRAAAEAKRLRVPLVMWVGMRCEDVPEVRAALTDCVHVHLPRRGDDTSPRMVIQGVDGIDYRVSRDRLTADRVPLIRRALGLMTSSVSQFSPPIPATSRPDWRSTCVS